MRSTVVLPQPEGPSIDTKAPLGIDSEKSLTTFVEPNCLARRLSWMKDISVWLSYAGQGAWQAE